MTVSIIIPVYNAEKYLKVCLDSAINQTYKDIEIIAVYDGYPDKSLEILKNYSDKVKVISKESGNAAAALNAGFKASKGEWIKRLDVDDVLYPNAVEELISVAKKLSDKKHTILYSNYDNIGSDGELIDEQIEPNFNELDSFNFNVILLYHHIGLASSSLIHRSTIEDYGMFNEKISFEDRELWLRYCLLHNCRLQLVPKTLVKYRIHKENITKSKIRTGEEKTDKIKGSILEKLNPNYRKKYQAALLHYKKNKPLTEKSKYFVRYKLFRFFPTCFSEMLINVYWYARRKRNS